MKLKLYSGEEVGPRAEILRWLFSLGTEKIQLILDEMLITVHSERSRKTELEGLAKKLDVNVRELSRYVSVAREIVLRLVLGKGDVEVQQDLIENGFSEQKVKFLFSKVNTLPKSEKDAIAYWGMSSETHDDRNHVHGLGMKSDVRTVIDNGVIIGILPISDLDFRMFVKDSRTDLRVRLELSLDELSELIEDLEKAREGLQKTTVEFKKKWGEAVVNPAIS